MHLNIPHTCPKTKEIIPGPGAYEAEILYRDCGEMNFPNHILVRLRSKTESDRITILRIQPALQENSKAFVPLKVRWLNENAIVVSAQKVWSIEKKSSEAYGVGVQYKFGSIEVPEKNP